MDARSAILAAAVALCLTTAACGGSTPDHSDRDQAQGQIQDQNQDQNQNQNQKKASPAMTIAIRSSAFEANAPIPRKYTGEGEDVSPPLAWGNVPEKAQQLALICDDPDAPRAQPWVHWVLYDLPPTVTHLKENAQGVGTSGTTDFGRPGYGGPMPPPGHGTHHYHFKLYALDAPLTLEPGATKYELLDAMKGHVLAQGELVGTYER